VIPESSHSASRDVAQKLASLCARLEELSPALVDVDDWPAHQLGLLAEAGLLAWGLPPEFGGHPVGEAEMVAAYEFLAAACLTTTFVLTQRNAAAGRIAASRNFDVKAKLLPSLSAGKSFATVGISHMTTSRQHLARPAVTVAEKADEFILDGTVPWVTGAGHAQHIVTGGTLPDGLQVLLAVPTSLPGLRVENPMQLLALGASQTATVSLSNVCVARANLLAGPVENVMKQGGGGAGSLTTSALAVGLTRSILRRFGHEAERRSDLMPIHNALTAEHAETIADLYAAAAADENPTAPSAETVRQKANSLVLRTAQAYLAASKGAGFVQGHPAERAVREAMFFLVWSCPQPVVSAALREFACVIGD
jgi:alkylation response protein AidB-like acyl-CoA dehydrogenase